MAQVRASCRWPSRAWSDLRLRGQSGHLSHTFDRKRSYFLFKRLQLNEIIRVRLKEGGVTQWLSQITVIGRTGISRYLYRIHSFSCPGWRWFRYTYPQLDSLACLLRAAARFALGRRYVRHWEITHWLPPRLLHRLLHTLSTLAIGYPQVQKNSWWWDGVMALRCIGYDKWSHHCAMFGSHLTSSNGLK